MEIAVQEEAAAVAEQATKGKTESGFEYQIPRENFDNYELVELLAEAQENPLLFPRAVTMFLGKEQTERLKDHVRTESGIVPAEKMTELVMEIMNEQKETKNS